MERLEVWLLVVDALAAALVSVRARDTRPAPAPVMVVGRAALVARRLGRATARR